MLPYGSCSLYVYNPEQQIQLLLRAAGLFQQDERETQATEWGLKGLGASRADGRVFEQAENGAQEPWEQLAEPAAVLLS